MKNFAEQVVEHVNHITQQLGSIPEKILLYRDGVGEGQVDEVVEVEFKTILSKMKDIYGDKGPRFTIVIVTKIIDDRFAVE